MHAKDSTAIFLALETVFDQCSVMLLDGTGSPIAGHTQSGKRQQTQHILPLIDRVLSQASVALNDVSALMFNRGPGAFSGIRINTAVVQALSFSHDIPCVGVSSLQAIAQAAYRQHGVTTVYSALDARMQQVYFGQYQLQDGVMQPTTSNIEEPHRDTERLMDYDEQTPQRLAIAGNGAPLLQSQENQPLYPDICPDASIIGQLGIVQFRSTGGTDAARALPKYVRHDAWKTLKQQGKS